MKKVRNSLTWFSHGSGAASALDNLLFAATHYQYRKRWNILLSVFEIDKAARLTPSGLRGGAAVHHYRAGRLIADVMWLLSLRNQETLESYIQEVAALNTMAKFSPRTRSLMSLFPTSSPFLLRDGCARALTNS